MTIKRIELQPADGRKSFYGKCYVEIISNAATLYSYNTKIATYDTMTGDLEKFPAWNHSMTTRRHQKAFFEYFNISE